MSATGHQEGVGETGFEIQNMEGKLKEKAWKMHWSAHR